jgi:CxxC motif-containing protein
MQSEMRPRKGIPKECFMRIDDPMRKLQPIKPLDIFPTGGALGAEIGGVDLREPIPKQLAPKLMELLY